MRVGCLLCYCLLLCGVAILANDKISAKCCLLLFIGFEQNGSYTTMVCAQEGLVGRVVCCVAVGCCPTMPIR